MEQEKRGLCPYDDKRYLLADMPDGRPNPNTHAYGHRDILAEETLVADHSKPGAELVIKQVEKRFNCLHARVIRRIQQYNEMEEKQSDIEDEINCKNLLMAENQAVSRPGSAIQMGEAIEQICARNNIKRPVSPPTRMPAPPTPQSAGASGLYAQLPSFRTRIDSSDEEEPEQPVWPPRRLRLEMVEEDNNLEQDKEINVPKRQKKATRRANMFIDTETGVDEDASDDEDIANENSDDDLDRFIVADDIDY